MIEFVSNIVYCDKKIKRTYPELLRDEVHFTIRIDNENFFNEPNFPIYEFMNYVDEWIEKDLEDMNYIAIDTEENPLISFTKSEEGYKIISPWQLFACERLMTRNEIIEAIRKFKTSN